MELATTGNYKTLAVRLSNGLMGSYSDNSNLSDAQEALEKEIREWWEHQSGSWDSENNNESMTDGGVWDHMPEIDSKVVTRTAPICEEYLDVEFDPALVRRGGYDSIDDLIDDLIPKLVEKAKPTWQQENDKRKS